METTKKRSLAEILAEKKALQETKKLVIQEEPIAEICNTSALDLPKEIEEKKETFSLHISLNKEQLLARQLAFNGKSFVLTGAAGTGKTSLPLYSIFLFISVITATLLLNITLSPNAT